MQPVIDKLAPRASFRLGDFIFMMRENQIAAAAMEMGAAAVLVNTAIAVSPNPVEMGRAFKLAVEAGRMAFEAKLAKQYRHAQASSPLTAFLD